MKGIYTITSISFPDRTYVGSCVDFKRRKHKHLLDLKNGKHGNNKLQNHYNKYGESDLTFEFLEEVDELLAVEQIYLDRDTWYFNIAKIAGSRLGLKASEETKKKQSNAMKVSMLGNKNGLGNKGNKGRKLSPETKAKIGAASKARQAAQLLNKRRNETKLLLTPIRGKD